MAEWESYALLEPFGWEKDNLLAAGIRWSSLYPHMKNPKNMKLDSQMFDFIGDKKKATLGPRAFMGILKALAKKGK